MHGSYWGKLAALGRIAALVALAIGALSFTWYLSAQYTQRSAYADARAKGYAEGTKSGVDRTCFGVEGAVLAECVSEQIAASREDQRAEYDLQAQQDSAQASFWTMLFGGATLIVTGIALWFIRRTLDATLMAVEDTSEATAAMRQQNRLAEVSQRPWIKFEVAPEWLLLYPNRISMSSTITFQNIGLTPAQNVRSASSMEVFGVTSLDINDPSNRVPPSGIISHAILPQDILTDQELTFANWECADETPEGFLLYVVVTVLYDLADGSTGETTRSFHVGYPDPIEPKHPDRFKRSPKNVRQSSNAETISGLIAIPALYGRIR